MTPRRLLVLLLAAAVLAGCAAGGPTPTPRPPTPTPAPPPVTRCTLPAVAVPTAPPTIPGYTALDPSTGLHMTGTPQRIDVADYRLLVTGLVDRPLQLTYDDLRCLRKKTVEKVELECPGFFLDVATWAGAPLDAVLALAGVQQRATQVRLTGADGYETLLSLDDITPGRDFLLAYEWEGQPLPILHGFPIRVVLPGITGGQWVKWLQVIEVQ